MFKISKLADYGVVVLAALADLQAQKNSSFNNVVVASDLGTRTHLPVPTVAKVLKLLAKAGLVKSVRGAQGGYAMARTLDQVSLADIIAAVDGPIKLTDCIEDNSECRISQFCAFHRRWDVANNTVLQALNSVTVAQMLAGQMAQPQPNDFQQSA